MACPDTKSMAMMKAVIGPPVVAARHPVMPMEVAQNLSSV